ncbi:neprilysin-2-like [Cimex lectularius]|uniref:Endothelin-converting enzyme n=1 Tax=Cimex lectularius TaxID=79782 RepID=A0A8I6REN0_CIMLE|nr:neprilysin-2-like [Cimex lectularius]
MWRRKEGCVVLIWLLRLGDLAVIASEEKGWHLNQSSEARKNEDVCMDKDCVIAGYHLLSSINRSVDPCDNFYQYACGRFLKNGSPNNERVDVFVTLDKNVGFQIRDMLKERSTPGEIEPVRLAKRYYNLCMDERKIERDGYEPLLKVFKEVGGWPVLEDEWDANGSWSWLDTIYKFREIGIDVNYLINLEFQTVNTSSTVFTITINPAVLGLSQDTLLKGLNDTTVEKYYNYMVDVAVLLNGNRTRARQELLHSLNFEIELAKLSHDIEKVETKFGSLKKEFPSIPLKAYVSNILKEYVSDEDRVTVFVPKYLNGLEKIMQTTPKRVVANYLVWRATLMATTFLPKQFRDLHHEFSGENLKGRWAECVELVSKSARLIVYYMYVQRYVDNSTKWEVVDLVGRMKKEIYSGIKDLEWMDDDTKDAALKKIEDILPYIGYNDDLFDVNKLIEYHKQWTMKSNASFYEAYLSLEVFWKGKWSKKFRTPFQRGAWYEVAYEVSANAYHMKNRNVFLICPPFLQGFVMTKNVFAYMNYATIGYIVGHEIFHGLDDVGVNIDNEGLVVDWWEDSTMCTFTDKVQCFVEQYNSYTVKQINKTVDGEKTKSENIADNAGLNYAYRAYLSWVGEHCEEPRLPGFKNYTSRQLFWISFANFYCSYNRKRELAWDLMNDDHSPDEFRVIGALSNQPYFSRDFGCPLGSNMNPEKKCFLW